MKNSLCFTQNINEMVSSIQLGYLNAILFIFFVQVDVASSKKTCMMMSQQAFNLSKISLNDIRHFLDGSKRIISHKCLITIRCLYDSAVIMKDS